MSMTFDLQTTEAIADAICVKGRLLLGEEVSKQTALRSVDYFRICQEQNLMQLFFTGTHDCFVFASIMNHHLVPDRTIASILVSYFAPEHRGITSIKLVKKFIAWAKEQGADIIEVDDCLCKPEVGDLYEKFGFKKLETHYYQVKEKQCQQ